MNLKESEKVELKKSTSELKEAVISIVSILNKNQKGELYSGVKNNGEAVGQDISDSTMRDISKAISDGIEPKIYPSIKKIKISQKSCIKVLFSGRNIPYFCRGRAYMRVGDEDRQLSAKEIEKMILMKNREIISWDAQLSKYSVKNINKSLLRRYIEKAVSTGRIESAGRRSTMAILRKLNLVEDGKVKKACEVLFYDKNNLEVQAAVFAGKDKMTFLDIKKFEGNIFDLLEKSENYIAERINWRVRFGKIERKELPEIPIGALREALVNSFCHRDYFSPKGNEIAIFKDRVEIYNPGEFPEGHKPEDFIKGRERSILRNPLIAEVLYKSKDIEKWGSGLRRIYNECRENHVRVEFKILKTGFLVVFYRKEEHAGKTPQKTTQKTTQKTPQKILGFILENPSITRKEIADKLGNITEDGVKYNLKKLVEEGKLERIGPDKGGYWKVKLKTRNLKRKTKNENT